MIDLPEVLEDLQAIVAEFGDGFVYEAPEEGAECVYRTFDEEGHVQPSCIVGHVLARHKLLNRAYAIRNLALHGSRAIELASAFYEDFTPEALKVLAAAQEAQDYRKSWGEALVRAKEAAEDERKTDA